MSPSLDSPGTAVPTVEELEAQERRLVFRRFTNDDAWALGSLLVELARERRAPVAIDIHRAGQQLFHAALPGSTPDNDAWIARKRRVVERYGSASYLVGSRFRAKGTTFEESSRLDADMYAAHGGSFPVTVADVGVIGSVTVSGLPQVEDHRLVVEALERFLGE
ncbi:heme-degrading domain-containing protein [Streptomyces sp. NPDC017454]|uniref:heme-degrading domain-containing protein n=1 Tax=unclassified Streptomyces TaxID=2593676 RepID=UPI00362A2B0E